MSVSLSAYSQTIPREFQGKTLTAFSNYFSVALTLLQFFSGALAAVPVAFLGYWISESQFPGPANKDLRAGIFIGSVVLGFGLVWLLKQRFFRKKWSNTYYLRLLKSAVKGRPGVIVDHTNPDAVIVEIVPRQFWANPTSESTVDMGFFAVDTANRRLLFEGDRKRWIIPLDAVTGTSVEWLNEEIAVLVVAYREPSSPAHCEFPMIIKTDIHGIGLADTYGEQAHIVEGRIHAA